MDAFARRSLLRGACAPVAALALASCGFALRSTQKFPFKTMYTGPIAGSPLLIDLSRQVAGTGGVEIITDQRQLERAEVIFEPANVATDNTATYRDRIKGKTDLEIMSAFLVDVRNGEGPSKEELKILNEAIDTIRQEDAAK